ncbi:glycosyltransferase [Pseudonocardia kujensis]|uniref:glycosyltransferase n=1 Tax=Pseudonocardia kujensis TaxID=1128675 RepID=UPI001E4121B0|nr:glycosyltransferase [Pseudonocardia kujensis]MCE0761676.1 glycosyltransferase [Pseudonocardia kujensis]
MRVLISSIAAHGHTYPLLPFAIAARAAGHEVSYATAPSFHPLVERLGFRPVAAGGEIREAFGQVWAQSGKDPSARFTTPPDEVMAMAGRVFGEVLPRRTAADLAPVLAELRPDVVVHEAGDLGAGLAAKVAGVRGLCHGFGRVAGGKLLARAGDHVGGLAAELGLDPAAVAGPGLGDPFLDICPGSLQDPDFLAAFTPDRAPRVPLRPVPFAEPAPLPDWVGEPGPPLVYLTLGTAFAEGSVLRTAIRALGRLPARVLVAAGPMIDAALVDDLPATVRVEQWVPQADLLPYAALVVHHGGSGTTLGALANGVPQLVLPQGADQFDNAGAVVSVGAGRRLLPGEATTEAVAETASSLLTDPEPRAVAAAVAREIAAMPSPAEVVAALLI